MADTEGKLRPGPNVTLVERDEILDRIAVTLMFSSVEREWIKGKYAEPIRVYNSLVRILR
jgi:hypothetical protein